MHKQEMQCIICSLWSLILSLSTDDSSIKDKYQLTLVGKGHSSSNNVMTAGPNGSSSGITLINDCTTSNQPSSESKSRRLYVGATIFEMWKYILQHKMTSR